MTPTPATPLAPTTPPKPDLFGLTLDQLKQVCADLGAPAFAAKQLAAWMYKKGVADFSAMSDLPKALRERLAAEWRVGLAAPVRADASVDGTKKYLYDAQGRFVEAAYIPEEKRATLCLSSQVGCKMGCLFCMTGKQGFQANLSPGQILNQVRSLPEFERLTHLVYMGMGEPLDNLEAVLASLEILTADWGFAWSPQKITVSTVGLVPAMEAFFQRSTVRFALSLHTPFEDERKKLMPVEQVYPLPSVLNLLKTLPEAQDRRVSIEYICFGGVNDTPRHVNELVRILHGLKTRVNLIKFHPIPGTPLQGSSRPAMEAFRDRLNEKGMTATIRRSRGEDIWAACGLLSTKALVQKQKAAADEDY